MLFNEILNYDLYYPLSFLFLILSFFSYFLKSEEKLKLLKVLFFLLIFSFFLYSFLLSLNLYFLWQNHPLSKYLLPPYQKINYFLTYVFFNYYRDFIWRIFGFVLVFIFLWLITLIFKRDPFYDEEKFYIFLSIFLFSFPYNFFFIFLSFFILLIMAFLNSIFKKQENYFSFKNYWLFLSLVLLILEPIFYNKFFFLLQLKP